MIRVIVEGIGIDPAKQPVVVLKDAESDRSLPIWIGPAEARAIELELRGVKPDRPLSHDLLLAAIGMAHAKVVQVIVNDLQGSTFFATIDLETPGGIKHIDSRPSDAIALAVRADCPIYLDGNVIAEMSTIVTAEDAEDDRVKDDAATIDNLSAAEEEEIRRFKRLLGEDGDDDD